MAFKSLAITSIFGMAVLGSPVFTTKDTISIKVVGGSNAEAGEFPFIVSLQGSEGHFCGGTLLDASTVLTAAHCGGESDVGNLSVRAGSLDRTTGGHLIPVASITVHPGWSDPSELTDVAIWKLESALPDDPAISFAHISPNGTDPTPGTMATVAGWGATDPTVEQDTSPDMLLKVDVPIIARDTCKFWYRNSTYSSVNNDMVCAGAVGGGRGSCFGDSGGPLVDASTGNLIGVVSWGDDICAGPETPGVYARVDTLRSWILQTAGLVKGGKK
ncbi:trypsin [Plectosphaerella plurivora]|uniref:Trypsin n=1 Tax=Plectosphaerella plurivora TaxID=936078 RepID=A0A9P8VL09_9PEZI|nr:trypsin [Plectosphaerella plurivora]